MPFSGELFRAERERQGLDRTQTAALAELSYRTVASIESGLRQPSISSAERLAAVLETPFSDFLVEEDRAVES